jgi:hypothetical protein
MAHQGKPKQLWHKSLKDLDVLARGVALQTVYSEKKLKKMDDS